MSNNNNEKSLVSIVIPTYNTEKFLEKTIESIKNQTYKNWEAIFIDDFSVDNSANIIKQQMKIDNRIKYVKLNENSGAAIARNTGVKIAKGEYIAFLDDDDLWYSEKLELQLKFMKENNYYFTCTYYDKIDDDGRNLDLIVKNKLKLNYNKLLKYNPGNSTVIYNSKELGKTYIPSIRKRNDYMMWLRVIRKSNYLYTLPKVLGSHRVRKNSLSSKKTNLIKYHWEIYRKHEKLSLLKSIYLIIHYGIRTILFKFKSIFSRNK